MDLSFAETLIKVATLVVAASGAWGMHARLRNGASRLLLVVVGILVAYFVFARVVFDPAIRYVSMHATGLAEVLVWSMNSIVPATLWLIAAVAFSIAAHSIALPDDPTRASRVRGPA